MAKNTRPAFHQKTGKQKNRNNRRGSSTFNSSLVLAIIFSRYRRVTEPWLGYR